MRGAVKLVLTGLLAIVLVATLSVGVACAWRRVSPETWNRVVRDAAADLCASLPEGPRSSGPSPAPEPGAVRGSDPSPGSPAAAAGAPEPRIDLVALEARLRQLESSAPSGGAPAEGPGIGALERKLAAWENLRRPLLELLEVLGPGRPARVGDRRDLEPLIEIELLAPRIAARLEGLFADLARLHAEALEDLPPASLAQVLAREEDLPTAALIQFLAGLEPGASGEVFSRLAFWSPARAASVLERLSGAVPAKDRGRPERSGQRRDNVVVNEGMKVE